MPFQQPACLGWSDNFWAQHDDAVWDTNFPSDAGPFYDTDVSDGCKKQDLTVGLYNPQELEPAYTYEIFIYAEAGEEDNSPFELAGQKKSRDCGFHPNCVGLRPPGLGYGESERLVGPGVGTAPGCRQWQKGLNSIGC